MQWSGRDTSLTIQKQSLFGKSSYLSEALHLSSKFCLWCCTVVPSSQWVRNLTRKKSAISVPEEVMEQRNSGTEGRVQVMPVSLCHGKKIIAEFWKTQMLITAQCLGNTSACLSSNKKPIDIYSIKPGLCDSAIDHHGGNVLCRWLMVEQLRNCCSDKLLYAPCKVMNGEPVRIQVVPVHDNHGLDWKRG